MPNLLGSSKRVTLGEGGEGGVSVPIFSVAAIIVCEALVFPLFSAFSDFTLIPLGGLGLSLILFLSLSLFFFSSHPLSLSLSFSLVLSKNVLL